MKLSSSRTLWIVSRLATGVPLAFVEARSALGQDLAHGVETAAGNFKSLVAKGVGVAALVIMVISLCMAGFRFAQKDPSAIWYVAGTLAGGVMFGVAKAMIGAS